jgi:hypothetical protein
MASGSMKLATFGLDYPGLPLFPEFASAGVAVLVIATRNAAGYPSSNEDEGRAAGL